MFRGSLRNISASFIQPARDVMQLMALTRPTDASAAIVSLVALELAKSSAQRVTCAIGYQTAALAWSRKLSLVNACARNRGARVS